MNEHLEIVEHARGDNAQVQKSLREAPISHRWLLGRQAGQHTYSLSDDVMQLFLLELFEQ
jgi:hypothetical protein